MEATAELLWRLYEDHQQMARHHNEQRSNFTQYMLILAAAAVGVAKLGETSRLVNSFLALFIIGVGLLGMYLMQRHSRDCSNQNTCANKYRLALEELHPEIRLDNPEPPPVYTGAAPWTVLHLLVASLGVTLLVCSCLHV